MMNLRLAMLAFFASLTLPAVCSAGLIEFSTTTSNLTTYDYGYTFTPVSNLVLVPTQLPASSTFDSASGQPVSLGVIAYQPQLLPTPAARDIHPDGTTHWNFEEYFSLNVTVTDRASGQSAVLDFGGRAHIYNQYSTQDGWGGVTDFWFQNYAQVTLGGNEYTVWSDNLYSGSPTVNVWVGPNPPVSNTPEPGTLVLVALGLVPFGLRGLRRMW
jgi:hypothetical protein